jgi:Family of unknown function (DUF6886)
MGGAEIGSRLGALGFGLWLLALDLGLWARTCLEPRPRSPDFEPESQTPNPGNDSVMLFHVSEQGGIGRFEPRASDGFAEPIVWAIDAERLRNYLVPRDCPRVTCYAGGRTTDADVERFLGSRAAVIAIEEGWLERLRSCRLYCYHMPQDTFECADESAGYFVSRAAVVPARVEVFVDP